MSSSGAQKKVHSLDEAHPEIVLGPHPSGEQTTVICALLPRATGAWIEDAVNGTRFGMHLSKTSGLYRVRIPNVELPGRYLVCFRDSSGYVEKREDPYSFQPEISDYDIYLFNKGELARGYKTLGAHLRDRNGTAGVRFTVWAPNAKGVSVIGNFNHWKRNAHPMSNVRDSGIWELFIPGLDDGEMYKFAIKAQNGEILEKTDPFAFRSELRPRTSSIVDGLDYNWNDSEWMEARPYHDHVRNPVLVYEVHLGSWRRPEKDQHGFMNYRDIADQLIPYVKDLGYTHIEIMPIMEHPLDASWGYQVVSYYSPTSRYGSPEDFMFLVDQCHRNGIGVILDWVPAHFPSDEHGLVYFDGTHLFEYSDPRKGYHPDWGTRVFDFGREGVMSFLISNAMFWLDVYHADGLRIDAVSSMLYLDYSRKEGEWVPNRYGGRENLEAIDFIRKLNQMLHDAYDGILTVAEESTAWGGVTRKIPQGGLGFDFKWNMGWMHDTLYYFSRDPLFRKYDHGSLTFAAWYSYSEDFILPLSHDEVVHLKSSMINKMPGDAWRKFANLRLLYSYMTGSPGKKLMFMGDEFAQNEEWNEAGSLQWNLLEDPMHNSLFLMLKDLNRLYRRYPQLHEGDCDPAGFEWIDFKDSENSVISFYRFSADHSRSAVFVFNMTPVPRHSYRIGVDREGRYNEVFNSNAAEYGGSGEGNLGQVETCGESAHWRRNSIVLTLPPLAAEIFIHEKEGF